MGFGDTWTTRERVGFFAVLALGALAMVGGHAVVAAVGAGLVGWSWLASLVGGLIGAVVFVVSARRSRGTWVGTAAVGVVVGLAFRILDVL